MDGPLAVQAVVACQTWRKRRAVAMPAERPRISDKNVGVSGISSRLVASQCPRRGLVSPTPSSWAYFCASASGRNARGEASYLRPFDAAGEVADLECGRNARGEASYLRRAVGYGDQHKALGSQCPRRGLVSPTHTFPTASDFVAHVAMPAERPRISDWRRAS